MKKPKNWQEIYTVARKERRCLQCNKKLSGPWQDNYPDAQICKRCFVLTFTLGIPLVIEGDKPERKE